jgi:hypothetical protein
MIEFGGSIYSCHEGTTTTRKLWCILIFLSAFTIIFVWQCFYFDFEMPTCFYLFSVETYFWYFEALRPKFRFWALKPYFRLFDPQKYIFLTPCKVPDRWICHTTILILGSEGLFLPLRLLYVNFFEIHLLCFIMPSDT